MLIAGLLLAALLAYLAVSIWLSRNQRPRRAWVSAAGGPPHLASSIGTSVTVSTWNLGYAGLGADADFVADRGKHLFPPSWASTRRNLAEILRVAEKLGSDVALYQEVSDASPLSYWAPLDECLRQLHADRLYLFQPDIATRLLVGPLRMAHGLAAASRIRPLEVETFPLPLEPNPVMGIIRRRYALQVMRFAGELGERSWTIIHLHLSAFDEGGLRERQLQEALHFAVSEYDKGHCVVMGGDWNLALVKRDLSRPEDAHALFWLRPFPEHVLPEGWHIAAPTDGHTVRTNHQPYVAGINPTATVDGFVVSPNVRIDRVERHDTGFAMSDHMPVVARFSAK